MTTWERFTVRMDPVSLYKLLLRREVLATTNPDASISTAARYTLRRIRFQPMHKEAFSKATDAWIEAGKPSDRGDRWFIEQLVDVLDRLEDTDRA